MGDDCALLHVNKVGGDEYKKQHTAAAMIAKTLFPPRKAQERTLCMVHLSKVLLKHIASKSRRWPTLCMVKRGFLRIPSIHSRRDGD